MEHPPIDPSSQPETRARPLWARAIILAAIWTMVLQPAVSSAQLAQSPMFTVTSAPPNVMLMFDDSSSMNRLDLNPPPAFGSPTWSLGGTVPALKVNTVGYWGVSGSRYYFGNNAAYDGRWTFTLADVLTRSPAFNPLAYNPAIQYQPWNNNGIRFPNSSIAGNTNIPVGARTEWDPRNLPPAMGGGTVYSKLLLSAPQPYQGNIDSNGEARSWGGAFPGSVAYAGLPSSTNAASGVDLFNSTIAWDNPNCPPTAQYPTNYFWYCPGGAGPAYQSPPETCSFTNDGSPSTAGRNCCVTQVNTPTFTPNTPGYITAYYRNPPGSPPAMTGPGGETCTTLAPTGRTGGGTEPPCTVPTLIRDDPPYEVPCADPTLEGCMYDPPAVYTVSVCTPYTTYEWGCSYLYTLQTNNYSCPTATPQYCGSSPGAFYCPGPLPLTPADPARYTGGYWTPARYVIYEGPPARTAADISDLSNYRMIMLDRKFGWSGASRTVIPNVSRFDVVDGVTGLPAAPGSRPDCAAGSWCTFDEEAQNYANWYTFYRSRLFAAVAVMSEVASGLTGPEQFMRMGYGRINYFPRGRNNWNVQSFTDREPNNLPNVDGGTNEGGVEGGVRPFTVNAPPLSATPNPARQAVFNWLFAINGLGPTPNREALHGAGLYFTRTDSQGPWGANPGTGAEPTSSHLWCRRNYTLLATDGEWTRLSAGQPLLESGPLAGTRSPLANPGTVSRSMRIDGPAITGTDRDPPYNPLNFTYVAASEPQITGGFGSSDDETLTDVLHYYWSHDLRSDLQNSLKTTPRNRAFWQHMSAYIVGYGVVASMDDPARVPSLRTDFDARNTISWPQVGNEACRQLDDNADDAVINGGTCGYTVAPSGNRINDGLRAGLASGGDFFSATSPTALKSSMQAVFAAIGSDNAAGTSPGLSSSTVGAGNLIIQSGFFTNVWDGYVRAFDQAALLTFLRLGGVQPAPLWSINFDTPTARPIYSSTGINLPIPFNWASLTATPYQAALGSSQVLDYLRGDQSRELRFPGGVYRNRTNTILGDIVSSTPLYSKAADHGYARSPGAAVVQPVATATQGSSLYGAYVTAKATTRMPIAIFGANDGMLHVLNARVPPATGGGREIFAYVPRSLYFTLTDLTSAAYSHRFYVDGPVIEGDVFNGTAWKTIAIGTTGAGAAGMFAIDITAPESGFGAANVLWDIVPSEHADATVVSDLGNVLQPGIIGSVKELSASTPNGAGRWVYMVGNGYESVNHQATLFVFDAVTGALIKAIQTGVGSAAPASARNGLGGITPVYDANRNIIAVYGGDKLGNMWKFNFSGGYINDPDGAGPNIGWEIFNKVASVPAPLFTALDGASVPQPISAAPRITPHGISGVHVGFGTGKLFEPGDQISTQVQSVYTLWDKGQIPTIAKASLQSIRLEDAPWDNDSNIATPNVADGTFRRLNAADLAAYDWTTEGFYIDLKLAAGPAEGERILSAGIFDGGVLTFTSFQQQSAGTDLCTPGGTSHVYRFNLIGGLGQAGFLGVTGPVVGKRVQPGLVSAAPPIYEPVTATGPIVDSMTIADAKTMMQNPKYRQQSGRAVNQTAAGTCAHVGLKVDGTLARIPTACAGLIPLRAWGSGVR